MVTCSHVSCGGQEQLGPPQLAVPPHAGLLLAVLGLLRVEGPAALQRYHCGATASRGLLSVALCYDSHYGFK